MGRKTTRREVYLHLICRLSEKGKVRGADLARELEVSRPTVCVYIKHLAQNGDIRIDPQRGICLTEQGKSAIAANRETRQELSLLLQSLGVAAETACLDAEKMEQHLSQDTLQALHRLHCQKSKDRTQT